MDVPTTKSTLFVESKDEWDTKEGTGKSMKNALHAQGVTKGTSRAEAMSNSEKIKPVVLAIVELHLLPAMFNPLCSSKINNC